MNGPSMGRTYGDRAFDSQVRAIRSDADIIAARHLGRLLAERVGFARPDQALIATAISELARNVVKYAGTGQIEVHLVTRGNRRGIKVVVRDDGPGIEDVEAALRDGFSTGGSLGLGLPGTRRIMDEFDLETVPGKGVRVTVVKWTAR